MIIIVNAVGQVLHRFLPRVVTLSGGGFVRVSSYFL